MTLIRRLLVDNRGATLVEFAILSPVLILMILGMFDMGYNYYIQSQMQGAVQKAARDSTIEGAGSRIVDIDARVTVAVRDLMKDATVRFARTSYTSFSKVGQPEDFTDVDGNGICSDGEPFEDANRNGLWDRNQGTDGMGGARDAVLYVVTVSYKRPFGVTKFMGMSDEFTTQATTVLRNQPYGAQEVSNDAGNC